MSEIRRSEPEIIKKGWYGNIAGMVIHERGGWVAYDEHIYFIETAVLAERERCAKLVGLLHHAPGDHACYSELDCNRIVSIEVEIKRGAIIGGGGGNNPGISGGSGTIEANVTKGYLLDGTEVSVENLGAESGVTIRPQPKFTVGDRVTWKKMQGSRIVESSIFRPYNNKYAYYIKDTGYLFLWEDELELYVPTPAELIPTLKEHEWVRFRVSTSGRLFTSTTYFDGDGSLCADDYQLRGSHAKSTAYNVNIESIERCDAPEVVK